MYISGVFRQTKLSQLSQGEWKPLRNNATDMIEVCIIGIKCSLQEKQRWRIGKFMEIIWYITIFSQSLCCISQIIVNICQNNSHKQHNIIVYLCLPILIKCILWYMLVIDIREMMFWQCLARTQCCQCYWWMISSVNEEKILKLHIFLLHIFEVTNL